MDSFYGGKRGFSFILRPNPDDANGYWQTSSAIATAAQNKILKQGEYAVVTETGSSYTNNHGKIYCVTKESNVELIGKIGNPAPLYGMVVTDDFTDSNEQLFHFLSDNDSKQAEGFTVHWKINMDEHDNPQSIGIGFEFPHPVFEVTNTPANYFQLVEDQIEAQEPAGITITSEDETPVYYQVKNVVPSATYIGTRDRRETLGTLNLNLGDLWMETIDDSYMVIRPTQQTKDLIALMGNSDNFDSNPDDAVTFGFPTSSLPTQYPYQTVDGRTMYDVLTVDFTNLITPYLIPKLKYSISSLETQTSKALRLNLAFQNEEYEKRSPFTHYDLYATIGTGEEAPQVVLQGEIGKPCNLTNFIYTSNDEPISGTDLASNIVLQMLYIYGSYSTTEQMGSVQHQNFIMPPNYFSIFLVSANNVTSEVLGIMKSFGLTWYPPDQEVSS